MSYPEPSDDAKTLRWLLLFIVIAAVLAVFRYGDGLHSVLVSNKVKHRAQVQIFRADWCGKCPSSAEIARYAFDYKDVADIVEVNVDKRPDLKEKYNVTRLPFIVICSDEQCIPMDSMRELLEWLDRR